MIKKMLILAQIKRRGDLWSLQESSVFIVIAQKRRLSQSQWPLLISMTREILLYMKLIQVYYYFYKMGEKKSINNFYENVWAQLLVLLERNKPVSPARKKKEALISEILTNLGDYPDQSSITSGYLSEELKKEFKVKISEKHLKFLVREKTLGEISDILKGVGCEDWPELDELKDPQNQWKTCFQRAIKELYTGLAEDYLRNKQKYQEEFREHHLDIEEELPAINQEMEDFIERIRRWEIPERGFRRKKRKVNKLTLNKSAKKTNKSKKSSSKKHKKIQKRRK